MNQRTCRNHSKGCASPVRRNLADTPCKSDPMTGALCTDQSLPSAFDETSCACSILTCLKPRRLLALAKRVTVHRDTDLNVRLGCHKGVTGQHRLVAGIRPLERGKGVFQALVDVRF